MPRYRPTIAFVLCLTGTAAAELGPGVVVLDDPSRRIGFAPKL